MAKRDGDLWRCYCEQLVDCDGLGLRLDVSRMGLTADYLDAMAAAMERAYDEMEALERGAIANPDENRRVGHYWLRAPWLAPTAALTREVEEAAARVKRFAARVADGRLAAPAGGRFSDLLLIGIGGSALGPQLLADALSDGDGGLRPWFFDNTDGDGMSRALARLGRRLDRTLVLVVTKSGTTPETLNGLKVVETALEARGLALPPQAAAITGRGTELDRRAAAEGWLARFPLWDWVGGRTSVTSAVGLLPAALLGLDADDFLAGAAACDELTRQRRTAGNPAALLALAWHHAGDGRGRRDMVVLPYRDRLLLLSRYLQQLVMESLGKERDRDGEVVHQGLTVYGNKGSTDQHAFVQQLRDGPDDFFVTFVDVLEEGAAWEVEPGITCGDYLRGFLLGTRRALAERGRRSLTITLRRLDAWSLGALIALFERAVGFYASLINVNAYHQPGVEAGKKAAADVLALERAVVDLLRRARRPYRADEIAAKLGARDQAETVFHLLEALAANRRGVVREAAPAPWQARYRRGPQ
ncbi:MAG: glucose-6-phosphate isomerase [Acidobacteria bacterium]|nr:MAG: glucose-6-phosphate isomerase [Acidobacteriota bacterium]